MKKQTDSSQIRALPLPVIEQVVGGILDPATVGTSVAITVPAWPGIAYRDEVFLTWASSAGNYTDDFFIPANWGGKHVVFTVPKADVMASLDRTVTVSYRVRQGTVDTHSGDLTFEVKYGFTGELLLDLTGQQYVTVYQKPPAVTPGFAQAVRMPTWGRAPYSFVSSVPDVVAVDQQGTLTALRNGDSRVTVRDQLGVEQSFPVKVRGIATLFKLASSGDWNGMIAACGAAQVNPVSLAEMRRMWSLYSEGITQGVGQYLEWTLAVPFWTGDELGAASAHSYDVHGAGGAANESAFDKTEYLQIVGVLRANGAVASARVAEGGSADE